MTEPWTREQSKERFPLPISPLGWSLLQAPMRSTLQAMSEILGMAPIENQEVMKNIKGYIYTRQGFFQQELLRRLRFGSALKLIFQWARVGVATLIWPRKNWPLLGPIFHGLRFLRSPRKKIGVRRFDSVHVFFISVIHQIFLPRAERVLQQWKLESPALLNQLRANRVGSTQDLLAAAEFRELRQKMENGSCEFFFHDFNVYFFKTLFHQWLRQNLILADLSESAADQLISDWISGLSGNYSVEMAKDINVLDSEEWLEKYGHLTDNWDIKAPTLGEQSEIFQKLFQTGLRKKISRISDERKAETEKQFREIFEGDPDLLKQLQIFGELVIVDEDMRAFSSVQYPEARRLFQRVAQTPGWQNLKNSSPEDLYFLTVEEIEESLEKSSFENLKELIELRKSEYSLALRNQPQELSTESKTNSLELQGQALSGGETSGPVVLVESFQDLRDFTEDNILVVRSPNPSYAPFYMKCRGLLSETGGILSHGALVAREFGIPMISGLPHLFDKLKTGDFVYMDANRGTLGMGSDSKSQKLFKESQENL